MAYPKLTFLRSKKFIHLVGIEYRLLVRSGEGGLLKFYVAGLFIFIILLMSFASIFYAFEMLFRRWQVEIFLATFFSCLFTLIYVLLIHTFSKVILPNIASKRYLNISNCCRAAFILFIGFIVSKPIEVYLLRSELDKQIDEYKIELLDKYQQKTLALFKTDEYRLTQRKSWLENQLQFNDPVTKTELNNLNRKLQSNSESMQHMMDNVRQKIDGANFFIKRIQLAATRHPVSWVICVIVLIMFCLPGYLIYSISADHEYFKVKHEYEKTLVLDNYSRFKEIYTELFLKYGEINITYYEHYEDPPFNTKKKRDATAYHDQDHFITTLLYPH